MSSVIPRDVVARLTHQRMLGKVPLFVLGAGVSEQHVPLLHEIGGWIFKWFNDHIDSSCDEVYKHTLRAANALKLGNATRRQVAELFHALQEIDQEPFPTIWREFSNLFLTGRSIPHPHENDSPWIREDGREFLGLMHVKPTIAHEKIAEAVSEQSGFVLSLNFDGLTKRALRDRQHDLTHPSGALVLHSEQDIRAYFTSCHPSSGKGSTPSRPAVFKVRGDVFYAKCKEPDCPLFLKEYPLDHLLSYAETGVTHNDPFVCPACGVRSLILQFQFPGYRAKEDYARPMLWTMRRFLGYRLSSVIMLGFSGRWDRFLLEFLFDTVAEYRLLMIDVKKQSHEESLIASFRRAYFPSISDLNIVNSPKDRPLFVHIHECADDFMKNFHPL